MCIKSCYRPSTYIYYMSISIKPEQKVYLFLDDDIIAYIENL